MIRTEQRDGIWYACWIDSWDNKQLGFETHDFDRDRAIYLLGLNMGLTPVKFTRPISDYFEPA